MAASISFRIPSFRCNGSGVKVTPLPTWKAYLRFKMIDSYAVGLPALILFIIANCFPFLAMKSGGMVQETRLLTGIVELWRQQLYGLATLVLCTCVLVPLAQMLGLLYVLFPLEFNHPAPHAIRVFRFFRHLAIWGMLEIFMLGILVALVKLGKMATIVPGISVYAFGALVLVMAAAVSNLDAHLLWERLDPRR